MALRLDEIFRKNCENKFNPQYQCLKANLTHLGLTLALLDDHKTINGTNIVNI